jgi:4-oxalocrotonate tautomerase
MPLARISILEGQPDDAKRTMIARVTDAIADSLRLEPGHVRVLIDELPPEHWGVGGLSMRDRQTGSN